MSTRHFTLIAAAVAALGLVGCATAKKDTTGFAIQHEVVLDQSYPDAWQHVKRTLLAEEFQVYTRDKRGTFVAYTGGNNFLGVMNAPRNRYTIDLESLSSAQTKVTVEVVKQVYGVSLTTYPDWHDRKTNNDEDALALIATLQGGPVEEVAAPEEPAAMEEAPAIEEPTATEAPVVEEASDV